MSEGRVLAYRREQEIGYVTVSGDPDDRPASADAGGIGALEAFLAEPSLKGVVIEGQGSCLPGPIARREAQALLQAIAGSPVPVAAATSGEPLGDGFDIAQACHFRFSSRADAAGFLKALTEGRSPHLIRTVMRAIDNSFRLPREEALSEETRLFCELIGRSDGGAG